MFTGTIAEIEGHLRMLGYPDARVYSEEVGYITVQTEEFLSVEEMASLECIRSISTQFRFIRVPKWARKETCFCFGPPAKDCPIHMGYDIV